MMEIIRMDGIVGSIYMFFARIFNRLKKRDIAEYVLVIIGAILTIIGIEMMIDWISR